MKVAIMQPYIFPYIGYYQLISSVDVFVILDDVSFITRGWINRNNILVNGNKYLFSIPVEKASQNKLISDTKLNFSLKEKGKFLKTIQLAYRKAPYFNDFYPVIEEIILYEKDDLTDYLQNSISKICKYCGINTKIIRSSELKKNNFLKSEDRIIEICKKLNTSTYINLPGGRSLYSNESFKKNNMELMFINTLFDKIKYKQYNDSFIENMSFVDVSMFNSKSEIINFINQYTLLK